MNYKETIAFLYNLQTFGIKFGLEGIQTVLAALGNPHSRYPTIHIAGTNGKGSTAAMVAAIFTAAGYRTGLYTSPHILRYEERIRINGVPMSQRKLIRLVSRIRPFFESHRTTFFEATTAIAFQYFAEEHVDIAIIETGLGGRLDATNVLQPVVSVITTIGMEHTHILGKTIRAIAREKGGIIKNGVPVITGVRDKAALSVLTRIAEQKHTTLRQVGARSVNIHRATLAGTVADIPCSFGMLKKLKIGLAGLHQVQNAVVAIEAVHMAAQRGTFALCEQSLRKGLAHIQRFTGFYGRMSVIQKSPRIMLDVAHNPDAVSTLVQSLRKLGINSAVVVFGVMKDKDSAAIVKALKGFASQIVAVAPKTERATPTANLKELCVKTGIPVVEATSVRAGVRQGMKVAGKELLLITGSHFVCAEAYAFLRRKKYLTINQ